MQINEVFISQVALKGAIYLKAVLSYVLTIHLVLSHQGFMQSK